MSDNWIRIIPEQPDFVPDELNQQRAVSYFRTIAPEADEIETLVNDHIVFVDCGANFETVACPSCGTEIAIDMWLGWMEEDFDGKGFTLKSYAMPCCGVRHTVPELIYDWPQGFARFELSAMNPELGELSQEVRSRFQEILGCPVRIIYQHI